MTAPKPRRRTIRFAIVAVVCLLLGAVTTVGVAWGLGRPARVVGSVAFAGGIAMHGWTTIDDNVVWGARRVEDVWGDPRRRRVTLTAGWPWLAAMSRCERDDDQPFAGRLGFPSWQEGVIVRSSDWGEYSLPVMPLWPGFALDTALYAAAWYLVIFTPLPLIRAGRRRFRVSRGMCGSCGYDLKGSKGGPCPECGA